MAGEWPEGFRLDPDAPFEEEIQRLGQAANADVVLRLQERSEPQASGEEVAGPCSCCSRPASHNFVVSYRGEVITGGICEEHGNAVARERLSHQGFRYRNLGPSFVEVKDTDRSEKAANIGRALTDANTKPQFERIREPEHREIARDTLERDRGIGQDLF